MIEKAFGTAKGAKDTSAWIEFFIKSTEGEKVKMCLKNENCYTVIASIAEKEWGMLDSFILAECGTSTAVDCVYILNCSTIFPIT